MRLKFLSAHHVNVLGHDEVMYILGPLLKELIDNIQHKISQKDPTTYKMYMYSAVSRFRSPLLEKRDIVNFP